MGQGGAEVGNITIHHKHNALYIVESNLSVWVESYLSNQGLQIDSKNIEVGLGLGVRVGIIKIINYLKMFIVLINLFRS